MPDGRLGSSFRDPSGFVFRHDGVLYRQINESYKEEYDLLISSGLYDELAGDGLLIPHEDVSEKPALTDEAYKVIKPQDIWFISYPYEWSFGQYRDAALLTLEIQKRAIGCGMSLKDCSAYNIQFLSGKPIFIDTLSFEKLPEGRPWVAYRQFCQHFLAPLALMSRKDIRLGRLMRVHIDGVPLDLASKLLGLSSRFSLPLLLHIHMHARSQRRHEDSSVSQGAHRMSRTALLGIIDNLQSAVRKLKWNPGDTEWGDYYNITNYSSDAFEHKKQLVSHYIDAARPQTVWDLGANTGVFSKLAGDKGIATVAFDIDPVAVEKNYQRIVADNEANIQPLLMDLTNPSSAIGWANRERASLVERGPVDLVMALALIHHLAISNNVPLGDIAKFLQSICKKLIIEFVPKEDSKVQKLLASREDVFPEYDQRGFENAFCEYFDIERAEPIEGSCRRLYLMKKKD